MHELTKTDMARQMDICSDGHDEIVHTNHTCPLCAVLTELAVASATIDARKDEAQEANRHVEYLEQKLESYEADYIKWKEVVDKLESTDYKET